MLTSIGLGRCLPVSFHSSSHNNTPEHHHHHHSSPSDTISKEKSFSSSSTTTTPSPGTNHQHQRQRLSASRLTVDSDPPMTTMDMESVNYLPRPYSSPVRPNSLVLASSKSESNHRRSLQHDFDEDDSDKFYCCSIFDSIGRLSSNQWFSITFESKFNEK